MNTLAQIDGNLVRLVLYAGGVTVALAAIIVIGVCSHSRTRQREQTRREIAAYVAEKTISAQDAALLLAEGDDGLRKQIASAVAWGAINPKDAERLLNAVGKSGPAEPSVVAAGKGGRGGDASAAPA